MKRLLLFVGVLLAFSLANAQEPVHTQIVAHRGYWEGNAQNSLASLRKAQEFGVWGSEFDLHLTADDVVVVNHDGHIGGTAIQTSPFSEVRAHQLANGEPVPTLEAYLEQGLQHPECVLVLELKPHKTAEREQRLIALCLQALEEKGLKDPNRVVFISFSYFICCELARQCPGFTVQYLEGDKTPAEVHADGISGIDYHFSRFKRHPEWVEEAHALGMSVNVWTVNSEKDLRAMKKLGVDQITTNQPSLARSILAESGE